MKEIIHKMFVAILTEKAMMARLQILGQKRPLFLCPSCILHLSPEKLHNSLAGSHEDHVVRGGEAGLRNRLTKERETKRI